MRPRPTLLLLFLLSMLCVAGVAQRHSHHPRRGSGRQKVISLAEARRAKVRKADLSHKLHGLHSHIHVVRAKIQAAKVKEVHINGSIQAVQQRLVATHARLEAVNDRLHSLEHHHDVVVARMNETRLRLIHRRQLLGARIRENYVRGQVSYAEVLVEASSLQDLLSRGIYVRQIVHSDAVLIDGVQRDLRQIQADKRVLEAQAREAQALAAEYESRKAEYAADLAQEQQMLQATRAARAQAEGELDMLASEAEEMTGRIQTLSAMLERRRQAELQARAEQFRSEGRHGRAESEEPSIAPVWHGDFIRPCSGPITSGFGYRYHPILHERRLHTGVDIGAPYGTSIHAAGGGTVILASYVRGYGNCVIIDHGGGITTLYGHCSELLVSEGQTVDQGQTIAHVGATGMATGPHLHFEVRHNGVPVPPF